MKARVHFGKWKNPRTEQRFRAAEDEFWHELWPDPPEAYDVDTHVGTTRAYRWHGEHAGGAPVVFLHG